MQHLFFYGSVSSNASPPPSPKTLTERVETALGGYDQEGTLPKGCHPEVHRAVGVGGGGGGGWGVVARDMLCTVFAAASLLCNETRSRSIVRNC